jgi:N6-adenosine-specific RNA methylase IME4
MQGVAQGYQIIYGDPPWNWRARSAKGEGRSAKKHYPVMDLEAIKRLRVGELAAKNSVLILWATDPLLDRAFEVIRAWGFKYKTVAFYWAKTNRDGSFFMGNGYYTRANVETCLLATRGKGLKRLRADVRRLVVAPRGRHSEKPAEVRRRIERLFGADLRKIELFARVRVPGWDAFGNEIEGSVEF